MMYTLPNPSMSECSHNHPLLQTYNMETPIRAACRTQADLSTHSPPQQAVEKREADQLSQNPRLHAPSQPLRISAHYQNHAHHATDPDLEKQAQSEPQGQAPSSEGSESSHTPTATQRTLLCILFLIVYALLLSSTLTIYLNSPKYLCTHRYLIFLTLGFCAWFFGVALKVLSRHAGPDCISRGDWDTLTTVMGLCLMSVMGVTMGWHVPGICRAVLKG